MFKEIVTAILTVTFIVFLLLLSHFLNQLATTY